MSLDLDDLQHISASDRERLGRLDQDPVKVQGASIVMLLRTQIEALENGAAYPHQLRRA